MEILDEAGGTILDEANAAIMDETTAGGSTGCAGCTAGGGAVR